MIAAVAGARDTSRVDLTLGVCERLREVAPAQQAQASVRAALALAA
jgi:hypothetical protein